MNVIESIRIRRSCRTFDGKSVEPEKLAELRRFLASNTLTPFGNKVRFELFDLDDMDVGYLKHLTTYGVIAGARHYIVGAVEKRAMAMEDYGYCMEKNILKATSMGLGTCILGGTFNRSGFSRKMGIKEGESLPVISPAGYPGNKRSVVDRVFRFVAASHKRKPWEDLFYLDDTGHCMDRRNSGRYGVPLECVRIAPSASNKQPWRIIKRGDGEIFHFCLKKTPGYGIIEGINLQNVDMGIAMCHFELSANELGFSGDWKIADPEIKSEGTEYIVSWIGRNHS